MTDCLAKLVELAQSVIDRKVNLGEFHDHLGADTFIAFAKRLAEAELQRRELMRQRDEECLSAHEWRGKLQEAEAQRDRIRRWYESDRLYKENQQLRVALKEQASRCPCGEYGCPTCDRSRAALAATSNDNPKEKL